MGMSLKKLLPEDRILATDRGDVFVYSVGLVHCSVCAPSEFDGNAVAAIVESGMTAGTQNGWTLSDDKTFASGEKMPCECNEDNSRRHWLLCA